MGYCGCMGYEALFPANQLSGLKNVWNLREYGVCEPWVMRESTVYAHGDVSRCSVHVQKQSIYALCCGFLISYLSQLSITLKI